MTCTKISICNGEMYVSLPLELWAGPKQTRQLEKDIEAYARKLGFNYCPIHVKYDGYGCVILYISEVWHCDGGHYDGEDCIVFVTVMNRLIDDGDWCVLPFFEELFRVHMWNAEGCQMEKKDGTTQVLEAICSYPLILLDALYDVDYVEAERAMLEEFQNVMERAPTKDERSYIAAALVEHKLTHDP